MSQAHETSCFLLTCLNPNAHFFNFIIFLILCVSPSLGFRRGSWVGCEHAFENNFAIQSASHALLTS